MGPLTPVSRYEIANGLTAWEDAEEHVKSKLQKSGKGGVSDVTVSVKNEYKQKRKDVDSEGGGKLGKHKKSKKSHH